ncbi:hypothetical protein FJM67_15675 [Maribrevibacterium harenarium]|uniref:TniQ domain-containing protein n=1 Tax=Maribrevibacterium harenarium TaxID=2589817 RepID=A0A501WHU3_9GAMM|nr:TniQ family protein [Maribrevibacterium harenarium]TPE46667.1 hypothetical protein FJM67_15675 [Maribrevibacterium harenarium]
MGFLPNSIHLYPDETVESVLLRLCKANHFERYIDLSIEIRSWLEEHHPTIAGAFPVALDAVNVYHAKQSSAKRVQSLQLLEQLVGLPRFSLLDISFKHTNAIDAGHFAEVRYKQITIPKSFVRASSVPVCIACLRESNYVRFDWHISKVTCCEKHKVKLLINCPACNAPLNYMISEDPSHCVCGFNLLETTNSEKGADDWRRRISFDQQGSLSISEQLALLLFLERYFSHLELGDFIGNYKSLIDKHLQILTSKNILLATEKINRVSFSSLTDNFLGDVAQIGSLPNFIKQHIANVVIELALETPRSTIANLGDSLVSMRDAALITGSTIDDIFRLYESGILVVGKRIRNVGRIESFNPVFRLRDVAAIALSYSRYGYSQSAW